MIWHLIWRNEGGAHGTEAQGQVDVVDHLALYDCVYRIKCTMCNETPCIIYIYESVSICLSYLYMGAFAWLSGHMRANMSCASYK